MDYLPWKDDYSVGLFEIDSQHRKLIAILNRLHAETWERTSPQSVDLSVKELLDYTTSHFDYEEALMEKCGYPRLSEHRAAHAELARRVREFGAALDGGRKVDPVELLSFLSEWLSRHILEEDMDYAPLLLEKLG